MERLIEINLRNFVIAKSAIRKERANMELTYDNQVV